MKIKALLIVAAAWMIAGCSVTKEDFAKWAKQHDEALVSAVRHVDNADAALSTIPDPPAPVVTAREELKGAKEDIGVAQEVSGKVVAAAQTQAERNAKLEDGIVGPRGKAILVAIGVIVALTGLAIALLRYGKLGGIIASVPILGLVVAKINALFDKKRK